MRITFAALAVLLAGAASAAENCGRMLRAPSRFHGTIRSIAPLAGGEEAFSADFDPLFAVVIDVVDVEPGIAAPRSGDKLTFAIHSPSRTFGSGRLIGRSLDLEAERMDCDGSFREFIRLRRLPSARVVETFNGSLEVGHSYRSKTTWEANSLILLKALDLPMHHDGEINFTNATEFFEQHDPKGLHEIVFDVAALHITMIGEREWLSIYDAKIISAK